MRDMRRRAAAALLAVLMLSGFTVAATAAPASAAACYGASCNGLDPEGRCSHDAKTVGAMAVTDGMLELRWSPSCAANWGRYTPYWRTVVGFQTLNPPVGIIARVTVWNPGQPSQGTANADINPFASTWSKMTDGRPAACTGVEVYHNRGTADNESQGWTWGPCY